MSIRDFGGGGKAFAYLIGMAILAAVTSAALVLAIMVGVQDSGTPLIGSDRWFIFYMVPVVFTAAAISVFVFGRFSQEKIKWTY